MREIKEILGISINPRTLEFSQDIVEKEFRFKYPEKYLNQIKTAILLAVFFIAISIFYDLKFAKLNLLYWMIEFVVISFFLIGFHIALFKKEFYLKHYQKFNIIYLYLASFHFIGSGYGVEDYVKYYYYFGIVLSLFFYHALTKQSFIYSSIFGSLLVVIFLFYVFFIDVFDIRLIHVSVYVVFAHLLGLFISYAIELDGRKSFLLMRKIRQDKNSVEQINLNLEKAVEERTRDLQTSNSNLEIAKKKAEGSDMLKSAFLANMSHEIRTPMNSILGFSNLLKRNDLSRETVEQYLEYIETSGNSLLHLISDIVDISKIDANQLSIYYEVCNINNLIDSLQTQFEIHLNNKGCTITTNKGLKDSECMISTDKIRLIQILSNLLENAIKFTNNGNIELGYTLENSILRFYVKDDGIGIDPKKHDAIFNRFIQIDNDYQKTTSGTGLGLAIIKSLLELLNGEIWVESDIGKGTTFFFTIPYNPKTLIKKDVDIENKSIEEDKLKTILIAEDEYSNYEYLLALFSRYNYKIIHAENGEEALEEFMMEKSIDVILMDIKMPVMNGYEAIRHIRKRNKKIPIIALTANAMAGDRDKALSLGCNDYISKPISEKKLIDLLNKYIK